MPFWDHSLFRHREGLHISPSSDGWGLRQDGLGLPSVPFRGLSICQWWADFISKVVGSLPWFQGSSRGELGAGVSCLSILFLGHTQGPCISLWGLRSSSQLVPLPLLLCSSCIAIMSIHMSFRPKLYFMLLWTIHVLASCKLFILLHYKKTGLSQRFEKCWDSPKKRWDRVKIPIPAFFFPALQTAAFWMWG